MPIAPLARMPQAALEHAVAEAPYLARLSERHAETVSRLAEISPERAFEQILSGLSDLRTCRDEAVMMTALRDAKQRAHLVLAGADLAGHWSVMQVTRHMTQFADAAAEAALRFALRAAGLSQKGLFLIALGKMGAHELNYSSDIDIAAFYDPDVFDGGERSTAAAAARVIRHMTRLLEARTGDGYVLRTDLRLRPDPRSTPVAVSTRMAEMYYESVGQNWERMVWIKARPFAGDKSCAKAFVAMMQSFVWRYHLDYWAINDIHAIKAMINASADRASLSLPHADVKLGPGGIREIEFFVQTQQLILGGRDTRLRTGDTLGGLEALVARGAVERPVADKLAANYELLRHVEHRIQMRQDEQTHTLPKDEAARASVARLCGMEDLGAFDDCIGRARSEVHEVYLDLFDQDATPNPSAGNLVFTGVDDDPGTVETLERMGFRNAALLIDTVRHWHRGYIPATRTVRGREILTRLLPDLLQEMGETGEADLAFRNFVTFFEHLASGVQTLSMLLAEAGLRRDLILTLAIAPRLAETLGRRPGLLEALLQRDLISPPEINAATGFEKAMDLARLYVHDQAFLIGYDLLHGRQKATLAARAFSDLADWAIVEMANAAEAECIDKFGPVPGRWCVAALGRLGGQAMTAASDLDIMVLYAPSDDDKAQAWFTRFTQRLITALSAPTAQGQLYEVDMRLRPSGRSGPVAVRMSGFEKYHLQDAWTWEQMALTRLRPVADCGELGDELGAMVSAILERGRDAEALRTDIADMRLRLDREKPGGGLWDLKLGNGGLVDLEFTVQHGLLSLADVTAAAPQTGTAIGVLRAAELLTNEEANTLLEAQRILGGLQQIQRIALTSDIDPYTASAGLKDRLQRAIGAPDFEATEKQLAEIKKAIVDIRARRIGALPSDSAGF